MSNTKPWFYALAALNVADMATTLYAIQSGWGHELNPVMAAAITFSPWLFVAIKMVAGVGLPLLAITRKKQSPTLSTTLKVMVAMFAVVVASNSIQIAGHLLRYF